MNDSECERIDIALSGGGTRAALYSGGALIAVQEAVLAGKVEVGAIHAVSGSSLMLARIILASDDRELDEDLEADLQLIKDEVEAIARHGFAPSVMAHALISLIVGAGLLLSWCAAFWLDGKSARIYIPYGPVMAILAGAAGYQLARRNVPFNLHRRRPRATRRRLPKQHDWFAKDHLDRKSALPATDVRFVCTSLAHKRVELVDPWHEYPLQEGMMRDVSLADCAGASAAVPIYSSVVRIGNDFLLDGGALDNLGCRALVTQRESDGQGPARTRAETLLVVDSSVPKQPSLAARDATKFIWEYVAIATPLFVCLGTFAVAENQGFYGRWVAVDIALSLIVLFGMSNFVSALVGRELIQLLRALRAETSVGEAVMESSRRETSRLLSESDRAPKLIELSRSEVFAHPDNRVRHDLRTRLSAVRGDTAAELVRASYHQVTQALGSDVDRATLLWLANLSADIAPRRPSRFEGRKWRWSRAVGRFLFLGWRDKRYWHSITPSRDSAGLESRATPHNTDRTC